MIILTFKNKTFLCVVVPATAVSIYYFPKESFILFTIVFFLLSGYLAIKFTQRKNINNDNCDFQLGRVIEDSNAMKYVKLIFTEISQNNLSNVEITNKNGAALCDIVNGNECEFTKVRNRLAILTSSVMPVNSEVDRMGMAQFSFYGNKKDIEIKFGKNETNINIIVL